jgi:hypothetical protein
MAGDGANSERVSMLEKKLFSVQEELTELHRRRSENAQQIIDQVCLGLTHMRHFDLKL